MWHQVCQPASAVRVEVSLRGHGVQDYAHHGEKVCVAGLRRYCPVWLGYGQPFAY